MIRCIKIAPYDLRPKGEDSYEYPADVAAGLVDPHSLAPKSLSFPGHIIFHSPLHRAVECVGHEGALRIEQRAELKEIPFDMRAFCTRAQWEQEGSTRVRRKFKEAFVEDTLLISRANILHEIKTVLADAHKAEEEGPVVLVSHSFRLKAIEAYTKTDGRIIEDPKLIEGYIRDDQKTYGFGEGFVIEA